MEPPEHLYRLRRSELNLAESHRRVALAQPDVPGSTALFLVLAGQSLNHARALVPSLERYGSRATGDDFSQVWPMALDRYRQATEA